MFKSKIGYLFFFHCQKGKCQQHRGKSGGISLFVYWRNYKNTDKILKTYGAYNSFHLYVENLEIFGYSFIIVILV